MWNIYRWMFILLLESTQHHETCRVGAARLSDGSEREASHEALSCDSELHPGEMQTWKEVQTGPCGPDLPFDSTQK